MDSVAEAARRPLLELAPELSGALVLLDAGAAEVAALSLGPAFLFGLRCGNVCELERTTPDDALLPSLAAAADAPPNTPPSQPPPLRLVILVTRLLTDAHAHVLRALAVHRTAVRASICCSLSELAHAQQAGSELGVEAYAEYADALRQDLARARGGGAGLAGGPPLPEIAVKHVPLHAAALDPACFVLPAAGAAAGMALARGRPAGFGPPEAPRDDGDDGALGVSGGLALVAHSLVDVAASLNLRLEPFALGPVSAELAREVASLPQRAAAAGAYLDADGPDAGAVVPPSLAALAGGGGGGGSGGFGAHGGLGGLGGGGATPAALILVDRALDLAAACGHADHFLDAAAALLERRAPAAPPPRLLARAAGGGGSSISTEDLWAAHRPADLRVDAPGLAPWDCLGPGDDGSTDDAGRRSGAAADQTTSSADGGAGDSALLPCAAAPPLGLQLLDPTDRRLQSLLDALLPRRGRDALAAARKALKDALRAEKVAHGVRGKVAVTPAELAALAAALAGAPGDAGLRQLPALAVGAAAARVAFEEQWAALGALERQIALIVDDAAAAGDGAAAAAAGAALRDLFVDLLSSARAGRGPIRAADALALLAHAYSLCGDLTPAAAPMHSADEAAVRAALCDALRSDAARGALDYAALPGALASAAAAAAAADNSSSSSADSNRALEECVLAIFTRLRWVAAARGKLRDARRLIAPGGGADGVAPGAAPLVRNLLAKVLLRADVRDFARPGVSSGAAALGRGLVKAGLGALRLGTSALGALGASAPAAAAEAAAAAAAAAARARAPHDHPVVVLFVVGGVGAAEWRGVRAELEQHTYGRKPAVLLGGTSLLAPADAARHALS